MSLGVILLRRARFALATPVSSSVELEERAISEARSKKKNRTRILLKPILSIMQIFIKYLIREIKYLIREIKYLISLIKYLIREIKYLISLIKYLISLLST
jgi:hypothetical protein